MKRCSPYHNSRGHEVGVLALLIINPELHSSIKEFWIVVRKAFVQSILPRD